MTSQLSVHRKHATANGTEIHYLEAGEGPPLVLLHGALLSTSSVWDGFAPAHVTFLSAFASRFRVIAPDTRGHGRTLHTGTAPIDYALLADDVLALSTKLGLDRPLLCGFSDGGMIALRAAARAPGAVRAVVSHGAAHLLVPDLRPMARQVFGGSPEAKVGDPDAFAAFHEGHGMGELVRRVKEDHTEQKPGGWRSMITGVFHRLTEASDLGLEDLRGIATPTLMLAGDRDMLCAPEHAMAAYRRLSAGELAVFPGLGHELSQAAVDLTLTFLRRPHP